MEYRAREIQHENKNYSRYKYNNIAVTIQDIMLIRGTQNRCAQKQEVRQRKKCEKNVSECAPSWSGGELSMVNVTARS